MKLLRWNCSDKKKCLFVCEPGGKVIYRSSKFKSSCIKCWFKEMFKT